MTISTTASLKPTMTLLTRADSRVPMMSRPVMTSDDRGGGNVDQPDRRRRRLVAAPGGAVNCGGSRRPKFASRLTR